MAEWPGVERTSDEDLSTREWLAEIIDAQYPDMPYAARLARALAGVEALGWLATPGIVGSERIAAQIQRIRERREAGEIR